MREARALAAPVAAAFLAGRWEQEWMLERARTCLEPPPRWLPRLVRAVLEAYPRPPSDRPRELEAFIARTLRPWGPRGPAPRIRRWPDFPLEMGRIPWPVPPLADVEALRVFLGVELGQLLWLADTRSLERLTDDERLRNYRYAWIARAGGPPRVIERPKDRLKALQRRVLRDVLAWIPAHPAVHGFVRGRDVRSHAALHTGRPFLLRFDLEDFFASVTAGRVFGIFRTAGYPEPVAHLLTALVTNAVPRSQLAALPRPASGVVPEYHRLRRRLSTPHLPQGAPTSPALANLCAHGLDRRLDGLAAALGVRYSRYADDIVMSGGPLLAERAAGIRAAVAAIVEEEGFRLNERKSGLMSAAGRQRVCGIIVNVRPNVPREEYDRLKAAIHEAILHGPGRANRAGVPDFRAHLAGRISWVAALNPRRAEKLRAAFARIDWSR